MYKWWYIFYPVKGIFTKLNGIELGKPETVGEKLRPILSNKIIFGVDLYEVGLGEKIENMVKEELTGIGAVRSRRFS